VVFGKSVFHLPKTLSPTTVQSLKSTEEGFGLSLRMTFFTPIDQIMDSIFAYAEKTWGNAGFKLYWDPDGEPLHKRSQVLKKGTAPLTVPASHFPAGSKVLVASLQPYGSQQP
jgi:hypothetical protein